MKELEVQFLKKTYDNLVGQMASDIAHGEVPIAQLREKLTFNIVNEIFFEPRHSYVKEQVLKVFQKVVDILKNIHDQNIRIDGCADCIPISGALARVYPTNWELSAARSIIVTRYIQKYGIHPENLSCVAYGEYKPLVDNGTSESRVKNHKIAIILQPKE